MLAAEASSMTKLQLVNARKKLQLYNNVFGNKICVEYALKTLANVKQIMFDVFKIYAKHHFNAMPLLSSTLSLDELSKSATHPTATTNSTDEVSEKTEQLEVKSLVKGSGNVLNFGKLPTITYITTSTTTPNEESSNNMVVNLLWNRLFRPSNKKSLILPTKNEKPVASGAPKRPIQIRQLHQEATTLLSNESSNKDLSPPTTERIAQQFNLEDPTENDAYLETNGDDDDEYSLDSIGSNGILSDVSETVEISDIRVGAKQNAEDFSDDDDDEDQFTFQSSCGEMTEHGAPEDLESVVAK